MSEYFEILLLKAWSFVQNPKEKKILNQAHQPGQELSHLDAQDASTFKLVSCEAFVSYESMEHLTHLKLHLAVHKVLTHYLFICQP